MSQDTDAIRSRTEAWFVSRGVPHFIAGYSAARDVLTRAVPLLTFIFVAEVFGAANLAWPWWANALAVLGGLAILLAAWVGANALRHRRFFARPVSVGAPEVAVFVLVPALLPLAFGGQFVSAAVTAAANLVILGAIYVGTSYAVVPMLRWAFIRFGRQLGGILRQLVRALPLLLLFVTFLFLQNEVWQTAIGVTASGRGAMAFTVVGADYYPSAGYASIEALSGVGDVHVAAAGLGPADGFSGYKFYGNPPGTIRPRWGDYGYTAIDGNKIWIASEYIGQTCTLAQCEATPFGSCGGTRSSLANWGTRISELSP